MTAWLAGIAALLAAVALALGVASAWKARAHRMAVDRRLEELARELYEKALAADRRDDDLLARLERLGQLEARLRLLETRDLAAEWQRQRGLEPGRLASLAGALDRLRDDLRLEGRS